MHKFEISNFFGEIKKWTWAVMIICELIQLASPNETEPSHILYLCMCGKPYHKFTCLYNISVQKYISQKYFSAILKTHLRVFMIMTKFNKTLKYYAHASIVLPYRVHATVSGIKSYSYFVHL